MAGSKGRRGGQGQNRQQRRAIAVSYADGATFRYEEIGGKIYETSTSTPREIETNLTLDQIKANLTVNGANVEELSKADLDEIEKSNAEYRKEMDKLLNAAYVRDKEFVRGSEAGRRGRRGARRGI